MPGAKIALAIIAVILIIALFNWLTATYDPPPPAVAPYQAPVEGSPPYVPPATSGQPPQPVWVDPNPSPIQINTVAPPLPTGQPVLPPPPPPVYVTPAASAEPELPVEKPTLYRGTNFSGDAWQVPGVGKFAVANSMVKNAASSIRIPTGWELTAYDKDDCSGASAVFTSDVDDLSGTGLDNDISCVLLRSPA